MNDIFDEYDNEEEIENELEKEIELPTIVANFEKVATSYSRRNGLPAKVGYYAILGDLVKHMIEIPFDTTTVDTRIHMAWIQTARTGKSTLINYVFEPLLNEIYKDLALESEVLKLVDYTTASLVGSYSENKRFDELAEDKWDTANKTSRETYAQIQASPYNTQERTTRQNAAQKILDDAEKIYENTRTKWHIEYGPLHGEGVWFADEFEGSGVFKDRSHKENMNIVFQTIMNNFHSGSNVYDRILTGKPTISLDSKYTIIACTFPPENLYKTVAEKGTLQRFLPYICEVEDDIVTIMRKDVIKGFGVISQKRGPPLELKKGIIEIYKQVERRYKEMGEDAQFTLNYHPSTIDAMNSEHANILKYIEHVNPETRAIIRLFEMNLMEYIGKLAVLNCISMAPSIKNQADKFTVLPTHIRQGALIVRECYTTLVDWLEDSLRIKHNKARLMKQSGFKKFKDLFEVVLGKAPEHQKREGNYVTLSFFTTEATKSWQCSDRTVARELKKLKEYVDYAKEGKVKFIRPIHSEEQ